MNEKPDKAGPCCLYNLNHKGGERIDSIPFQSRMASSSSSSSGSGLTFKVHPLVIVNISDHHTRVKSQSQSQPSESARVYGCVIGVQRGRTVEIFNSFELLYDGGTESLDRAFLEKKQELYKKVFPELYVLGWYSTGSDAEESDMAIHKSLMDINENPVYVVLDPSLRKGKDLPLYLFESELHLINSVPSLIFVRSSYSVETVEAERISVDHVAHLKPDDGASAATHLAANLTALHSAISMLNSRIRVLHQYLLSGPHDSSLLRQLSSLLRRLPAIQSRHFHDDFLTDYNDTLLVTHLAMFTSCSSAMNELVDKFNTAYDRHSRRGGRTAYF